MVLTGPYFQRYTKTEVGNFLKTAITLVVIVSVATILVSPDTTDDIDGVLQHHFLFTAHLVFHTVLGSITRLSLHLFSSDLAIHRLECLNLLDLVCVRLC